MASNMDIDADNAPDVPLIRMSVWGEGNFTRSIPLQPDGFNDALWRRPSQVARDANLGLVRDQDHSQEDIEDALRRNVPEILRTYPRVLTVDGLKHKMAIESKIIRS
jgi:hypothetical protein